MIKTVRYEKRRGEHTAKHRLDGEGTIGRRLIAKQTLGVWDKEFCDTGFSREP